jgi:hypothetical protein
MGKFCGPRTDAIPRPFNQSSTATHKARAVVFAFEIAEEAGAILRMRVVIGVDEGSAAPDHDAVAHGEEEAGVSVAEELVASFKKAGDAQQPRTQILVIEKRHVGGIGAVVAPVERDEPPQLDAVFQGSVAEGENLWLQVGHSHHRDLDRGSAA